MLLDTCVLSELARPQPDALVTGWFERADEQQFVVSVLTLGEIEKGAARLPRGQRRRRIEEWLASLRSDYADRLLPIDDAVALRWGRLAAEAEKRGRGLGVIDGLLAATALERGVPVVTRNGDDFAVTGVRVINPWEAEAKRRGVE